MKKLLESIANYPKLVLLAMTLLLIPSIIGCKATNINCDILSHLPTDLKSTQGQPILNKDFKNVATGTSILEGSGDDAEKLRKQAQKVDGVEDVISKTSIIGPTAPNGFLPDDIRDIFHAKDSTLMTVKFSESSFSMRAMKTIGQIKKIESKQKHLSGINALVEDTKDLIDRETPIYVMLAVAPGLVMLSLTNESTVIPFVFMLNIGYAVICNFGINIFLGQISYITKAITAVLQLAVTMDYSIFLYHRYAAEKKKRDPHAKAMAKAIETTFSPLFSSSLTTFAGFLVLILMRLSLGKDIGLIMSKGVFIGFLSTLIILPPMLLPAGKAVGKYNHKVLLPEFDKLSNLVVDKRKVLALVFIVLSIPAIYGSVSTRLYYDLDRSLPQDLDSIVSLNKMKKDYNMANTHFVVIKDNLSNVTMNSMIDKLKHIGGINSVVEISSITGVTIPITSLPDKLRDNSVKNGYEMIMVNPKYQTTSEEVNKRIAQMRDVIAKHDKDGCSTDKAALTDDLTDVSDQDFKMINIASLIAVFIIIAMSFKSFRISVALITAIGLAIQVNMTIPFYFNQAIPFITSIVIGVVQLGSTIDYSVLITDRFLYGYRETRDSNGSSKASIRGTFKSIVASALSFMAATIGVRIYSKMEIVSTICMLLARGVIISMPVVIILLPAILSVTFPFIRKTTKSSA